MLMRILAFLLETFFFGLICAALLRAWMNGCRVNMRTQLGIFVMGVTDWIVKPLRRILPKAWMQSWVDWASVMAAATLALAYALVSALLFAVLADTGDLTILEPTALLPLLVLAVKMLIRVALQTAMMLVLGFVILSWVKPGSPVYSLLGHLTEPLRVPLRRVVPVVGGVDLSTLALIVMLQIGLILLG